jgi:acyl-coenzyme A thioesterase PaaI-like protein
MSQSTSVSGEEVFRRLLGRPGALRLFLLRKLPLAWLAGIRLHTLAAEETAVTIRHRWINQNPFRSLYFGAQAMAAELSTGLLVMQHTWEREPGVSMLVTGMRADFTRKATGLITFRCTDGPVIRAAVTAAIATGDGQNLEAISIGTDETGAVVARFVFTWAVKQRAR